MSEPPETALSRREREILDIVYRLGEASASAIRDEMEAAPSYSAVRGLIRVLCEKGHLRFRREGVRNVYEPTSSRRNAGRSAMRRTLDTFFAGDLRQAVAALIDVSDRDLDEDAIRRLRELIADGSDIPTTDSDPEGER